MEEGLRSSPLSKLSPRSIAAKASAQSADRKLTLLKSPDPADIQTAQTAVDSAQANLTAAQAKLVTLRAGATAVDLASARASVDSAKVSQATADAKLTSMRSKLNTEKAKNLIDAYVKLRAAQEMLAAAQARNAPEAELATAVDTVTQAWRAVRTLKRISTGWVWASPPTTCARPRARPPPLSRR